MHMRSRSALRQIGWMTSATLARPARLLLQSTIEPSSCARIRDGMDIGVRMNPDVPRMNRE
jgi:hypothetical protein